MKLEIQGGLAGSILSPSPGVQFTKWLAGQVEAAGIDLFMGFAGQSVLYDGTRVIGVRTGDRGIGKDGKPKGAYEPGADIHAKVTIFADGVRGHLTKQLIQALSLDVISQPAQFAVGLKELRQIVRDARTLAIVLFMPFFLLLLYGYALNFDIRHVRLAVQDRDHSATSRALVSAFVNSGYFDLVATIGHEHEIRALVDSGRARAVLVIPEGTARRLAAGRSAEVQVIVNGDNANTASAVVGYATAIVRGLSAALRAERLGIPPTAPIALEPRVCRRVPRARR